MAHQQPGSGKRKSVLGRLSLPLFKTAPTDGRRKPRVKRLRIPVSFSWQLVVSLRRFRTREDRRSKRIKQTVFQVDFLSFREVAVALHKRGRPPKKRLSAALGHVWPKRLLSAPVLASTILVIMGTSGTVYFSLHLKAPVKLDITSSSHAAAESTKPAPQSPPSPSMPRSDPLRIRISKIDLDTSIIPVGLDASGAIAMPDAFDITGWYTGGPTPGQIGPAVIVGHVDSIHGIAIFWRLRELVPGDIVSVDRQDGTTANFKVIDIKQFPQDAFPTSEVYGNINYAGLRLITCGGVFNTATHHYSHNTVVYGQLMQ